MKSYAKIIVPILLLTGCASSALTPYQAYKAGKPFPMYYKAGVNFAQIANANTNCRIEAAQRVPARTQIVQTPTYTTPVQTMCNGYGTGFGTGYGVSTTAQTYCTQYGGQTYGGDIQSYDANIELRNQAELQCMAAKGYRAVNIPACPAGVDLSDQANERVLRPLKPTTCYQIPAEGVSIVSIGDY